MKTVFKVGEMLEHSPGWLKDAILHAAKASNQKADNMELHRLAYSERAKTNQLSPTDRRALKYVSARTVDRDGEIIIPQAIDLTEFRKYAHVLVNHNYSLLPVGSDENIEADDFGIKALTRYADTGEGTLADIVWKLISQGHLKASSIGFIPTSFTEPNARDWDTVANKLEMEWPEFSKTKPRRIITGGILLEHSDVSVPCNVDAELIGIVKSWKLDEKIAEQLGWRVISAMPELPKDVLELAIQPDVEIYPTLKPYPNEHSARLTNPDKYKRFARKNNAFGDGIHAIFGILEDGKTELQAIRFDKDKFTVEEAKKWLKQHKYNPILFEPAAPEKIEINGDATLIKQADAVLNVPRKVAVVLSANEASSDFANIEPVRYVRVLEEGQREKNLENIISDTVERIIARRLGKLS